MRGETYRLGLPVMRVLRRLFPASIRARIRQLLFEWLDMTWPLPSGVRIRVAHYGDWAVYNEVFVNGEYDDAIAMALAHTPGRPLHVVDLGANVGFFSLRVVDRLRQRGEPHGNVRITAVEADEVCARRYLERVHGENGLGSIASLVRGAVGQRTGRAILTGSVAHFPDGRLSPMGARGGAEVPCVDLSSATAGVEQIDLLKCDIEGSEEALIENYRDVFQKVRLAVFEFHRDLCDVDRCQALLREYGFTHHVTFRRGEVNFTYGVWR